MIRTTPYNGFAGCAWALSDFDLKPGLGGIKNPVLLHLRHQGRDLSRHQGDQRRGARLEAWSTSRAPDTSANVEQPEKFTKTIRDFVKGG